MDWRIFCLEDCKTCEIQTQMKIGNNEKTVPVPKYKPKQTSSQVHF